MLIIIATPIGNLKDITLRALKMLNEVDAVICEDSRRTGLLLNHFQIKKPLIVVNDFNEAKMVEPVIERLRTGQNLALVSDAGMPLVSDPGYKIIRQCISEGIEVDCLPGPSAVTTALVLSGLPPYPFTFLGYLPEKQGKQNEMLAKIKSSLLESTYLLFAAPHKLVKNLQVIQKNLGDLDITIAFELTKMHQNVKNKKISEWLKQFEKPKPKGEAVLLFHLTSSA